MATRSSARSSSASNGPWNIEQRRFQVQPAPETRGVLDLASGRALGDRVPEPDRQLPRSVGERIPARYVGPLERTPPDLEVPRRLGQGYRLRPFHQDPAGVPGAREQGEQHQDHDPRVRIRRSPLRAIHQGCHQRGVETGNSAPTSPVSVLIDGGIVMNLPDVVSRDEWLVARKALLAEEKEFTKRRDALNTRRRELPMVLVDKPYVFTGPAGLVGLADLFEGRLQLVVYHFMFQPEWDAGCPNCTGFVDEIGSLEHLHARTPRSPWCPGRRTRNWPPTGPSAAGTSPGTRRPAATSTTTTTSRWTSRSLPFEYNYRSKAEWDVHPDNGHTQTQQPFDLHGLSCFLRVDEAIHHTYSTYGRGPDAMTFTPTALDLTALGRQEPWEKPAGRIPEPTHDDHCH